MEYISYILITLAILVWCLLLILLPALREQKKIRLERASKETNKTSSTIAPKDVRRVLQRELQHVPTPWGWPGYTGPSSSRNGAKTHSQQAIESSSRLQSFVGRLFREKITTDDQEYLLRRDASLRALIEDHRYGATAKMKAIPYRKVKPPRLRDPSAPHDQMDNFPSGKADRIAAQIPRQPKSASVVKKQPPNKKAAGLKDMRTPWGW